MAFSYSYLASRSLVGASGVNWIGFWKENDYMVMNKGKIF